MLLEGVVSGYGYNLLTFLFIYRSLTRVFCTSVFFICLTGVSLFFLGGEMCLLHAEVRPSRWIMRVSGRIGGSEYEFPAESSGAGRGAGS